MVKRVKRKSKHKLKYVIVIIGIITIAFFSIFGRQMLNSLGTKSTTSTTPQIVYASPGYFFHDVIDTNANSILIEFSVPVTEVRAEDLTVNGVRAAYVNGSGKGPYIFTGYPTLSPGNVTVVLNSGDIKGFSWTFRLFRTGADDDDDGLTNEKEVTSFSDPTKMDTDDDGLPDPYELAHPCFTVFINEALPHDEYGRTVPGNDDADSDGRTNLEEFRFDTDPCNPISK